MCTNKCVLNFNLSRSICECNDPRPRFGGLVPNMYQNKAERKKAYTLCIFLSFMILKILKK